MSNLNLKPKNVLRGPRITEKAAIGADKNGVYVFEVEKIATKKSISDSVREIYKVTPERVRVVNVKPRAVFVRGKKGFRGGIKKAYVTLKKGDKIELI
ncbi:MAG: 50S ribosomal protein L23 [bacterium]|nr:50S ribosomal protein L23 [bacterium]